MNKSNEILNYWLNVISAVKNEFPFFEFNEIKIDCTKYPRLKIFLDNVLISSIDIFCKVNVDSKPYKQQMYIKSSVRKSDYKVDLEHDFMDAEYIDDVLLEIGFLLAAISVLEENEL